MSRKKFLFITIHATELFVFCAVFLGCLAAALLIGISAGQRADAEKSGRLAIVIDDFGLQRKGVKEMLALDCKLTVAIIPFLEHTEDDAEDALENGKEIIIHIPMQAGYHDKTAYLGPRPVTVNMPETELHQWMSDAVNELPEAVGANIHMGTLCSTKKEIMEPIMKNLRENNLLFLDSKTSGKSICRQVAKETGISFYENNVFLEHEMKTKAYVKKCLKKAMKIARKEGECIAIGHVGYEGGAITAQAICEMLPEFKENRVDLVFLSELSGLT